MASDGSVSLQDDDTDDGNGKSLQSEGSLELEGDVLVTDDGLELGDDALVPEDVLMMDDGFALGEDALVAEDEGSLDLGEVGDIEADDGHEGGAGHSDQDTSLDCGEAVGGNQATATRTSASIARTMMSQMIHLGRPVSTMMMSRMIPLGRPLFTSHLPMFRGLLWICFFVSRGPTDSGHF